MEEFYLLLLKNHISLYQAALDHSDELNLSDVWINALKSLLTVYQGLLTTLTIAERVVSERHRKSYLSYATVQALVHLIHHGLRMHTPIEVALMDDEQMLDDALYQKVCRELNELETSLGSEDISTICVDILTKK